jgi:uncharacterized lipoprotein YehR (DUF1307 family)
MFKKNIQMKNSLKKINKILTALFAFIMVFSACNKKCDCTSEPCPCFPFTISVFANANNSAEGSFATKEIDEFYLYRTNENYQTIDSVKIKFTDLFSNADYNKIYRFSSESFTNVEDIRPYNFIIKNTMVGSADTISSITYSEVLKNLLCNVCSNCDDEYIDCVVFEDVNFEFDCEVQTKAEVAILRKSN